jgi:plasmid maintenance system antidote protein VapI
MSSAKNWNIFSCSGYKKIMDQLLRKSGARGVLSRAAEALNCQRSYLSRIINGEMHLTPDQAYLLCKFWRLKTLEQEYFQCLVDLDRAASGEYREHIKSRLTEIVRRNESLSERMQRPEPILSSANEAFYFSSWHWAATHFLTSISEYQSLSKLSEKLAIPKEQLLFFLERLKAMGYVGQRGSNWEFLQGEFHLPNQSPFVIQHHQNWRHRAVLDAQTYNSESVHYTNVQTAKREDIQKIKNMLFDFISKSKETLDPSCPEEAVVILCDVFKI